MIRVGILGCGDIAQKSYLPSLTRQFKGLARVSAVCDIMETRAVAAGERYGVPAFTDAPTFLQRGLADVVVILTPLLTHARLALAALQAGKHVYTEKPLAATVAEASALLRQADAKRRIIAAAPSASVTPAVLAVRKLLASGLIGKVCLARAHSSHGGPSGVWNTDYSWVYRKALSGPVPPIYDMGVYGLSTLAALLGPVTRVTALSGDGISPRRIEVAGRKPYWLKPDGHDNAFLLLDFGAARFAALDASYCLRVTDGWPIELFGSEGLLQFNHWAGRIRVFSRTGGAGFPKHRWTTRTVKPGRVDPFMAGLEHMLTALARGRRPLNGGLFSRHLVDIMESAIRSSRTGRTLKLRTTFPTPR